MTAIVLAEINWLSSPAADAKALSLAVTRMNKALAALPESPDGITYFAREQITADTVDDIVRYYREHGWQAWLQPGRDILWLCVRAEYGRPLPPVPTAA